MITPTACTPLKQVCSVHVTSRKKAAARSTVIELKIQDRLQRHPSPFLRTGRRLRTWARADDQAVRAQADYRRRVEAFQQAKLEADRANSILNGATKAAEAFWKDLSGKKYINADDFTNGVAGDLVALHRSTLNKEAARLLDEAKTAEARYLKSAGGSAEAKFQEKLRLDKTMSAGDVEAKASAAGRRLASKIPVIGLGIAAAGIGYDIHEGKPPGKAIVSGVVGTAGSILAASTVGGPVGVAAGVGVVAGVAVGLGADWVYDNVVPEDVKRKIDDGIKAVGSGIADAGKAVGDFVGSIF